MARARSIKPGFFTNETLGDLPPLTRLLYAGLWTLADREGRLEDRPKRIKMQILPYDRVNVDSMLGALSVHGFLIRYVANGERFICLPSFCKHQNPHMKEPRSTIPAPGLPSAVTGFSGSGPASFLTPLTPKANPGRDPDALWTAAGFDGPEAFEGWFTATYQAHPTRGRLRAAKDGLQDAILAGTVTRSAFEEAYRAYGASPAWQRDGGRYIANLGQLVEDQFWKFPPKSEAQVRPRHPDPNPDCPHCQGTGFPLDCDNDGYQCSCVTGIPLKNGGLNARV